MKTIYCDKVLFKKDGKAWLGYHFNDGENTGEVFIDFRVISYEEILSKLPDVEIEKTESVKLNPIYSKVIVSNGRNNPLITIDLENRSYKGDWCFGGFDDNESLEKMLAYGLLRAQNNDIKVYKIDGIKVI